MKLIPFFLILSSCASVPTIRQPEVPVVDHLEKEPLPTDPAAEVAPPNIPLGDWAESLEKGDTVGKSGIFISEERAWRDAQYRIKYKELRSSFERSRNLWITHREYYEKRISLLLDDIDKLKPSILDRYIPDLLFIGGLTLGIATGKELKSCP